MIPIAKPFIAEEEAQAAYDTILTGWITQGPRVQEFEENFASYVGSKYAVAVSNCTVALHLSMLISDIGPGDEVICPSMSYIASANCIVHAGATPIFAEVGADYNLDPQHVEKLITENTKAILLVHQIGFPADIDAFKSLCEKYKLTLIEDAACAIGSSYKKNKIGSHSDLVCFSFHPRKVISTGDGGMITTNDEKIYKRLKLLRQHGMSVNDRVRHSSKKIIIEDYLEVGYNYRLTDIQASVGIVQLKRLDWIVEERRKIAKLYLDGLMDINCIELPIENTNVYSNYQSFAIYIKENSPLTRNELMQILLDKGVSTRPGIMCSHTTTAYQNKGINYNLPNSETLSNNSMVLPLYVPMNTEDVNKVIDLLHELLLE